MWTQVDDGDESPVHDHDVRKQPSGNPHDNDDPMQWDCTPMILYLDQHWQSIYGDSETRCEEWRKSNMQKCYAYAKSVSHPIEARMAQQEGSCTWMYVLECHSVFVLERDLSE